MTRKETQDVLHVIQHIKNPDALVKQAEAICLKQLAYFDSMRGQLREQADTDYFYFGAHP